MNRFTRILALLLLACLLVPLAACGTPQPSEPAAQPSEPAPQPSEPAPQPPEPAAQPSEPEPAPAVNFRDLTPEARGAMKIDIYLLAGQSNASGSTTLMNAAAEDRDHNEYGNVAYCARYRHTNGEVQFCDQDYRFVTEGMGNSAFYIGPELGMARYLNPLYDTDEAKALIIKVAVSATSLLRTEGDELEASSAAVRQRFFERGSWLPALAEPKDAAGNPVTGADYWRPTGFLTRELTDYTAVVYADLVEMGFRAENIRICSLAWMQGEEDRAQPERYAEVFPLFCGQVRAAVTDLTGTDASEMPVIVGEISETFSSSVEASLTVNRKFIEMQNTLPEIVPAVYTIPTRGFAVTKLDENGSDVRIGTDNAHWSYVDMLKVGELFGKAAYEYAHG